MSDIYRGLPEVNTKFDALFVDGTTSERKYSKTLTTSIDADMYAALQALVHDPRLPFNANMAAMVRHCLAAGVESLRMFLNQDEKIAWEILRDEQRRMTTELYSVTIEKQLDTKIELLEVYTAAKEWQQVYEDLTFAARSMKDFRTEDRYLRTKIAQGWMSHPGLRRLRRTWQESLAHENQELWRKFVEVFDAISEMAQD